jgi:hypothetical protein
VSNERTIGGNLVPQLFDGCLILVISLGLPLPYSYLIHERGHARSYVPERQVPDEVSRPLIGVIHSIFNAHRNRRDQSVSPGPLARIVGR